MNRIKEIRGKEPATWQREGAWWLAVTVIQRGTEKCLNPDGACYNGKGRDRCVSQCVLT